MSHLILPGGGGGRWKGGYGQCKLSLLDVKYWSGVKVLVH